MPEFMTDEAERMRTISITATPELVERIDEMEGESRSEAIRFLVGAVLEASRNGETKQRDACRHAALQTMPPMRRAHPEVEWVKSISWFPIPMLEDIREISELLDLRPADFVRGVLLWALREDPLGTIATPPADGEQQDATQTDATS